jgi:hypothetical protein
MPSVTLEKVMKDMQGFPYELQMYCYHHLNGRIDEGQTYLDAYKEAQKNIGEELDSKQPSYVQEETGASQHAVVEED